MSMDFTEFRRKLGAEPRIEDPDLLAAQAARLQLSSRQLIWLNPLMRWDGFTPQAAGIRALLPHVDTFQSCHNLNAMTELADALSVGGSGDKARLMAML